MIEQLPSLSQIYDFTTQDLRTLVDSLTQKLNNQPNNQQLQDYIENINIELQQRKTLQFFQQICAIDNPYLRKVTDFNNQFLQLAGEALAQQQAKKQTEHTISDIKQKITTEYQQKNSDAVSVSSAAPSKQALTEMESIDAPKNSQKTHSVNGKKTWKDSQKKMGIGNSKNKSKNSMKDFIMSQLNKNKAEGCYVIKKGGPPKPQPAFTVNERGHLVSPSTLKPISTQNIKSPPTNKVQNSAPSSMKQLSQAPNKLNEKAILEKREEVFQKMKGKKAQKKKQKPLNNKDLVEMIRQQQKAKQEAKKAQKKKSQQPRKPKQQNKNIQEPQVSNIQRVQPVREASEPIYQSNQKKAQVYESIQQIILVQNHERQSQQKKQEKQQIKQELPSNQQVKIQEKEIKQMPEKTQEIEFQKRQQQIKQQKQNDISKPSSPSGSTQQNQKPQSQKYQSRPNSTIEVNEVEQTKEKVIDMTKKQEAFGKIIDLGQTQKVPEVQKQQRQEQPHKKCYNEQYWIHIRQQAQFQIKRFKQQKQLQENHKSKIKQTVRESISQKQTLKQQQQVEEVKTEEPRQDRIEKSTKQIEEQVIDQYYEKKKKQLKKLVDNHKKRVVTKRPAPPIISPPKPIYALPQFNYLEVYPSFNHIFSVMYTKAEHQALQDIPNIMKQITNIFSTHQNHFKDKAVPFQPAIFLPFDSSSKFQLRDPRQLLLHTQSTYVNLKKMVERLQIFNNNLQGQYTEGENRYYRVVKSKQQVYDIITSGFLRRKYWKQLPHGCSLRASWNLFWSWSKPDIDISRLLVWQRINHFPFNKNLSRKDLLYKNLDSFRKLVKTPFNFLPLTFNLPKQYTQFSMKFHEEQLLNRDRNYWIMKPIGKSRGRGIKVISSLAELNYTDNIVVQKYINNPLLLDGYKFDMRIYVLVTSFHPLQAFVYRQGFARLSTQKFSLDPIMIKNAFVHLTNFSVNKNNEEAKQSANFSGGSKISLKTLKDKLTKMDYSFSRIWSQVHQIIIKSLLGCSVSVPPFPAAFQLFGYDIMIDDESNCHLIQINASPSLQRSYLLDEIVKQSLIDDILDIVDPPDFDKKQLLDVMAQRLSGKGKITPEEDLIALARVLKYKPIRRFGEMPQNMGLFERVAPCQMSGCLQRVIKSRSGANNPRNID